MIAQQTRRSFLKTGTVAAAAATLAVPAVHAGEDNTIRVALVGCGGRGTGAAMNALATASGPIKLVAMADVFQDRLAGSLSGLAKQFGAKVDVPAERQFLGFQAYRQAIDAVGPGGLVLLTTPPGFRPAHLEYAVEKGVHVFMEKSFGVDSPGVKRILKAGEAAKAKNLKIAGGLMWRHELGRQALVKKCHDGELGDLHVVKCYRMHGPVGYGGKGQGMSDLAHQIRNYNSFRWTGGTFILDWLIHDIDVCCWAKGMLPVSAIGHGGRAQRTAGDECYDHFAVEYFFPDGTICLAQGRHMDQAYNLYSCFFHGTKGSAFIEKAIAPDRPRVYRNQVQTKENEVWRYGGELPNPYQREHDLLVEAIRTDQPYNEAERCAKACLVSIMGRMACESGQRVTWDQAMASDVVLAPGLEAWTGLNDAPPVLPGADGNYAVMVPGKSKVM